MTGVSVRVKSPAKINWWLHVLGRRQDGFHEIRSLLSAITLYDELTLAGRNTNGIELLCNHPDVPTDHRNLIVRAGMLLAEAAGIEPRATCRLHKEIPIGGGLGGGSSNGAAALVAFNRFWGLGWSVEQLTPLAAELGSDVPFFLQGGSAIISGRGERIRPVRLQWNGWVVLLFPPFAVSTAEVYRAWRPPASPLAPTLLDAMPAGVDGLRLDSQELMSAAYNMLEQPLLMIRPEIGSLLDTLQQLAGRPVRVSGSGSTLFTAYDNHAEAMDYARRAHEKTGMETRLAQLHKPGLFGTDSAAPEAFESGGASP
ncbi:MAG: 4-(cytidine 5'-diphospho)-2-C-methyl-D-erythritol kinase [Phycisphaerae bacterium]